MTTMMMLKMMMAWMFFMKNMIVMMLMLLFLVNMFGISSPHPPPPTQGHLRKRGARILNPCHVCDSIACLTDSFFPRATAGIFGTGNVQPASISSCIVGGGEAEFLCLAEPQCAQLLLHLCDVASDPHKLISQISVSTQHRLSALGIPLDGASFLSFDLAAEGFQLLILFPHLSEGLLIPTFVRVKSG